MNVAERARMLRQHGMRRRYHHDEIGWNTRLDGFQGAVLQVKLKYIAGWNEARRAVAERYHALFHASGLAESGTVSGAWHCFAAGGHGASTCGIST